MDTGAFHWQTHAAGAQLCARLLTHIIDGCPATVELARRLGEETGTRLHDWLDHLEVPAQALEGDLLRGAGFLPTPLPDEEKGWRHPGGRLPAIVRGHHWRAVLRADDVAVSAEALGTAGPIGGDPGPGVRQVRLRAGEHAEIWAVERLGTSAFSSTHAPASTIAAAARWRNRLLTWRHAKDTSDQAFIRARAVLHDAIAELGCATACDLFFAAERTRWQRRNRAAGQQKWRNDRLGLGWANHDHHTFRSSRHHFADLIACLELLGLQCRERFHAGAEAGWGAQVLEHPRTGIVVFADVDLAPDEIANDIAHDGLEERDQLGTVGLWCALHGDSFLAAGLHHLACLGDFAGLRRVVTEDGQHCMDPFTDFPYLRQCFTTGETWPVATDRLEALRTAGRIDSATADRLQRDGARGSHLELIERNEAFKGFNQSGVSHIITATDPRR